MLIGDIGESEAWGGTDLFDRETTAIVTSQLSEYESLICAGALAQDG